MPEKNNQLSVFIFVLLMCLVCAGVIVGLFLGLKDRSDRNEQLFNKKAILKSVQTYLDTPVKEMEDDEVESIFNGMNTYVVDHTGAQVDEERIIAGGYLGGKAENIELHKEEKKEMEDRLWPVFQYKSPKGDDLYIFSVRGNGLWDKIWGNIAIKNDFNTVAGVSFDHKGETPGLGAEITDNAKFPEQFQGKELYTEEGEFVSVLVRKGGARESNIEHEVDGITGATITCNGVTDMMYKGLKYYEPFIESQKKK